MCELSKWLEYNDFKYLTLLPREELVIGKDVIDKVNCKSIRYVWMTGSFCEECNFDVKNCSCLIIIIPHSKRIIEQLTNYYGGALGRIRDDWDHDEIDKSPSETEEEEEESHI